MVGEKAKLPRMAEFYRGQTVFLTGFTGFIGQLLVEKLLWSCSDLDRIYVLIRGNRKMDSMERINEILNSRLFSRLREHKKELLKKVIPVEGDILMPGLGLSPELTSEICQNVTIVFHSAASVRFNDPLPQSLDINVKGSKSMLEFALGMPKLIAYNHVSTAYSNSDRIEIEEKIYPPLADWKLTLEIRDKIDEATLSILSAKYMNHMANSYVFAKALAEQVVVEHSDKLPCIVFRPSIVTGALFEPIPGWVENLNGPNALINGVGTGVVRVLLLNDDMMPDFMPADVAVKALILSACARVVDREDKDKLQVYNCCSKELSINFSDYNDIGLKAIKEVPFKYMIWSPNYTRTSSCTWFFIQLLLFQLIPALFFDVLIRLAGRPPILWKVQKKIYLAMNSLNHFMMTFFCFHNQNLHELNNRVCPEDLKEFYFLTRPYNEDLYAYFKACIRYQAAWFCKMTTDEDYAKGRRLSTIMQILDWALKGSICMYIGWKMYELIPTLISSTYRFIMNF